MTADVIVTYHAREQYNRLSNQERQTLERVLNEPADFGHAERVGDSDQFVSRFGHNMRVFWQKLDDGKIVVRSVVAA